MTLGILPLRDHNGRSFVFRLKQEYFEQGVYTIASVISRDRDRLSAERLLAAIKEDRVKKSVLRGRVINVHGEILEVPPTTWNDVVLEDGVRRELEDSLLFPLKELRRFEAAGLPTSRGILLEGPPGVGKTTVGRVLASGCGATFILVTPGAIKEASDVQFLYSVARRLAPTIVFIEEIDLVAPSRGDYVLVPEVLAEILNQLDGIAGNRGVFTVLTTNRPQMIERALADRPGRIERRVRLESPGSQARRKMVGIFLGKRIRLDEGTSLDDLAAKTDGFTGAHLKELVTSAATEAMKRSAGNGGRILRVGSQEFATALAKVKAEMARYRQGYA